MDLDGLLLQFHANGQVNIQFVQFVNLSNQLFIVTSCYYEYNFSKGELILKRETPWIYIIDYTFLG